MTASTRRELRSAATSTSTTAIGLIRALTDARPIKPTSTRCLSARRPNPAEAPLIDAEILFRQPQPPQSTNLACSVVPTMESCPNCKSEMSITQVMPFLLVDGFEDITYRCTACGFEVRRTFKRRSGAWELVMLPSFPALRP